jgi:hypothetical protein
MYLYRKVLYNILEEIIIKKLRVKLIKSQTFCVLFHNFGKP